MPGPSAGHFSTALAQNQGQHHRMHNASDATIRSILTDTQAIALVGFSANPARASHTVARFLVAQGYRVIPVNPGLAGQVFEGEPIRASLADCPPEIDMVDIFRRSEEVRPVVDAALAHLPNLRTIWMQIGVHDPTAAEQASAQGLRVVWNKCPKIEHRRLMR
jgi:predicted CoA-binding protein